MAGLIIVIILLTLVAGILFSPIVLRIDSERHTYRVSFGRLVRAWVDSEQSDLTFHVKIPMYHFRKRLGNMRFKAAKEKRKAKEKERTKSEPFSFGRAKRIQNILKSFQLTTFYTALDTDDYVTNAQLFPVGVFLTYKGFPTYINFQGKSCIILEVRNTIWRMIMAYSNIKKY